MATTTETTHADVPTGRGATSAKTFELIAPEQRKLDLRQTDGRAEVTYTLENKKFHPARGRLEIEPSGATQAEWLRVAGERHRDFRSREAQDFRVRIAIPPDAPANTFEFTAVGINEANPEEDFTERERSSITIDWEPAPIVKRISKWKLALMVLAPLLVLGVGGAWFYHYVWPGPPRPLDVLEQANQYASDGKWENYWECWTKQGQHKLLSWVAAAIQDDLEEADQTDQQRWNDQLRVWLPSFGLTLKDVQGQNSEPPDIPLWEQGQTKIERHRRTSKDFFVTAAAWREPDQQDAKAELPKEERKDETKVRKQQEVMLAKTREEFMFWPLCREDFKKSMADQMALYLAVPYDEKLDKTQFPKRCYPCSELKEDALRQDATDQERKEAKELFDTYKDGSLHVSFRNVDGVWLLDDFWKSE